MRQQPRHANERYDREIGARVFDLNAAWEDFDRAYIDQNGVVRWSSNDHVPFDDMLFDFLTINAINEDTRLRSNAAREADVIAFAEEYRRRQPAKPSAEELFEIRANFDPGTTLIDVISGRKITV